MRALLCFALENEAGQHFADLKEQLLFTGVGKLNAAYALANAVSRHRPDIVINLGTAGSGKVKTGSVVCATRFIQHDMDVTPLGFKPGETPFDPTPALLENGRAVEGLETVTCGSGDRFVVGDAPAGCDILEMEAYALAKVCLLENIPFIALKYISDGADGAAAVDWPTALDNAGRALRSTYNKLKL